MKNYVKQGDKVTYTNAGGADIASGAPVVVGDHVFIASGVIVVGATGELEACGVYSLAKEAPLAIGQGEDVYWDATAGKVTKTASGNKKMGHAHRAAASADVVAYVTLRQ